MSEREELASQLLMAANNNQSFNITSGTARAIAALLRQPPAPVQVNEDKVKAIVAKAMEEAWSDFCVDANAYPPDITNRRGRISFSPHTWADWTGALVYRALEAALQSGVPSGWKIVPEKPTAEMLDAYDNRMDAKMEPLEPEEAWDAMYAAAPAPGEGR